MNESAWNHPSGGRRRGGGVDTEGVENAVFLEGTPTATWQVARDGTPFASVVTRADSAGVVVATQIFGAPSDAARISPHRFADLEAADLFVNDLVASFAYLGCQVARL